MNMEPLNLVSWRDPTWAECARTLWRRLDLVESAKFHPLVGRLGQQNLSDLCSILKKYGDFNFCLISNFLKRSSFYRVEKTKIGLARHRRKVVYVVPVVVEWRYVGFFHLLVETRIVQRQAAKFHVRRRLDDRLRSAQHKCGYLSTISRSILLTNEPERTVAAVAYEYASFARSDQKFAHLAVVYRYLCQMIQYVNGAILFFLNSIDLCRFEIQTI